MTKEPTGNAKLQIAAAQERIAKANLRISAAKERTDMAKLRSAKAKAAANHRVKVKVKTEDDRA